MEFLVHNSPQIIIFSLYICTLNGYLVELSAILDIPNATSYYYVVGGVEP